MSSGSSSVRVGRSLNHYELLHELGAGGMATVYLGRARGAAGFARLVAIKVCHPHLRRNPAFAAQFLDEARLAAHIRHPNVVATLDVADEQSLHLVMEYVEGGTLSQLLERAYDTGVRVPVGITARILADALAGLHAAHEQHDEDGTPLRIVHRDVSPQNVLLGFDGVARIADFGIVKAESRLAVTDEGRIKGKLGYMAPESIRGDDVTRAADVYAAGVVLWESLAGTRLHRARTHAEAVERSLHARVDPPSRHNGEVPAALDRVALRALDRDPAARYATAAEMAEAIEHATPTLATARVVGQFVRSVLASGSPAEDAAIVASTDGPTTDTQPDGAGPQPSHEAGMRDAPGLDAPAPRRAIGRVLAVVAGVAIVAGVTVAAWRGGHSRGPSQPVAPRAAVVVPQPVPVVLAPSVPPMAHPAIVPPVDPPIANRVEAPASHARHHRAIGHAHASHPTVSTPSPTYGRGEYHPGGI